MKVVDVKTIRTSAGALEQHEVGPVLEVVPLVAADHSSVELTATATVKQFLGYTETEPVQPIFRDFSASARATMLDGQTLVMSGSQKQSVGELPADAKQIFVLVMPTLIDPGGNRLHVRNDEQPESAISPQP